MNNIRNTINSFCELLVAIALIICVGGYLARLFSIYFKEDTSPIIYAEEPKTEVIYYYIPTPGYELTEHILPEHIADMDDFEKSACMMAQVIFGEGNGLTRYEKSLIAWSIVNRLDDGKWGKDIPEIITRPNQFLGYSSNKPITDENYKIAVDVLMRWSYENYIYGDSGRTLPKQYTSFWGDGKHNYFRTPDKIDNFKFDGPDPYGDRPSF